MLYFAAALHEEWGSRPKDYAVLQEKLDTPFTQANERLQAWLRYSTWLQKQVEEPMFGEAFSLKQVFVPLRAYYNRKVEKQKDEDLEERIGSSRQFERVVVELEAELEDWLSKAKRDDAIRLISGGPGSGKSSLTKMFAAKVAEKGNIRVLFIPLHHFEPSDDLIDAVGKFVKFDRILPDNPLDAEHREERLLIIFDGLDELAMQGKIAEKTAQDFVGEVQRKVERFNQHKTCVQVLISGREVVVQANEPAFRKEGQIFYVLPYFLPEHDRKQHYVDTKKLLQQDQRQLWWQRYGKPSGSGYTGLPPELNQGNLTEITAQPLLNYLVALSLKRGALKFSEETNLNAVYADLLKAIYERGWAADQHVAIKGIEEKDFVRLLEEIALASWHGNGRTTTVKEIESHCDKSRMKDLLTRFQTGFQEDYKASVTRLFTAFYFRQSGNDNSGEKTFEFTHKSFGEYLTAKRIVREVRLIHKKLEDRQTDPDEGWDEREALQRWAILCGSSAMDEYLFKFVLDEVGLEYLQDSSDVAKWQQTFCHLIGFMLRHGMPMERLDPRPNFQEENRQARNSEDSLLAILGVFNRLTKEVSEINFPSHDAFGILLARLQGQRTGPSNPMSFYCLSYLDISECSLYMRDFYQADFRGSNLQGSQLLYANFIRANLQDVNLQRANLQGANLQRANLQGADLQWANLEGANLEGANLQGANLEGANLQGANLQGANLEGANLQGANLIEAKLIEANLQGANLQRAELQRANLEGANLEETILEGEIPGETPIR
ncbi:pentapeptide repeat-containing protein [Microcoleus vaginatus]|uniref:pentapeptide repeat-containing protein n=1 Tax=Microcoleus vaginatus TaxID=119532 RepID=UPI001F614052|nr:pentapeptide repeat-containing protein [Microcoleus vaginatus HSN003]